MSINVLLTNPLSFSLVINVNILANIWFAMYFCNFVIISPGKKTRPFICLNWIPFTQEWFMPNVFEIGPVVLERKIFFNLSMYFRNFIIIFPWKRMGPSFEQTWIPCTQGCFVPSLVEIGPMVLEKKMKMWKVYDNNDNNDDDGQRTNFDKKNSVKVS